MLAAVVTALVVGVPLARATSALQDFAINVDGSIADYQNPSDPDPTTLTGLVFGLNASTGLGTITFTFNGSPGSHFVNFYLENPASPPFYNEQGIVNGSAGAGLSYEIAQLNPNLNGIKFYDGTSEAFVNSLDNTNHVPGGNTNFLNNCAVAPCNGQVALALGFNFTLAANEQAIITFNTSSTAPTGFSIEDFHPVDLANTTASAVFLNGSINIQPTGSTPEPTYFPVMAVAGLGLIGMAWRRKLTAATERDVKGERR